MNAEYRVKEIFTDEETMDVIANCYDILYGEDFEKFLGNPDDFDGKENASALLNDPTYEISPEIRADIEDIFGVKEFDDEQDYDSYQFYDFGDDDFEDEDEEEFTVPTSRVRQESFNLREALNQIDIDTYNKYDLLNLYESCDLSENEKRALANIVYDQEDAEVIYDTLNNRYVKGEEIGMPERVKDGVIHEDAESTDSFIVGKTYVAEFDGKNYGSYEYVDKVTIDGEELYKFKPLDKEAIENTKDLADDNGIEYDGFAYMTDEEVFYTFKDGKTLKEGVEDLSEEEIYNRVVTYLENHPYDREKLDDEDVCDEVAANLFGIDYYKADGEISHTIFNAVTNYFEEVDELTTRFSSDPQDLYKEAMKAYDNGDDDFFYNLSDDELVILQSSCHISEGNPFGAAYDDEVFDAISDRTNSRELFNRATKMTLDKMDVAELNQLHIRYFSNTGKEKSIDELRTDIYNAIVNDVVTESVDEFEFDDEFNAYYDGYTEEDKDENSSYNKLKKNVNEEFYDFEGLNAELRKVLNADEIDNHGSDLYVKKTPESAKILKKFNILGNPLCTTFIDQITHTTWYEIPFGYVPNEDDMGTYFDDIQPELEESVDEDTPHTKKQIEADLKTITNNFTDKEGELKCGFEEEKNYGVEILKQHYKVVETSGDDRRDGTWYHISFADPIEK